MKRFQLLAFVVAMAFVVIAPSAFAETRLFIPNFHLSSSEDTQLLVANSSDRDATLDLWAFTQAGELLGQYQMPVKAHGTRAITMGEAFELKSDALSGWVGAVSSSDGIQLTYTSIGERSESYEAQTWSSRSVQLTVNESRQEVVRFANPNAFATTLNVSGNDADGRGLSTETVTVTAFAQLEVPVTKLLGGRARSLNITSNADIVAGIDAAPASQVRGSRRARVNDNADDTDLALVIDSSEGVGAYQVTLRFDPNVVQFVAKDIQGGTSAGFDSRPLVVNVDNVAGMLTVASFQVGAKPAGRVSVARIHAVRQSAAAPRFGLKVDEITNTTGESLIGSNLSVGLVRTK